MFCSPVLSRGTIYNFSSFDVNSNMLEKSVDDKASSWHLLYFILFLAFLAGISDFSKYKIIVY